MNLEIEELIQITFHLGFQQGSCVQKNATQGSNLCVTVSSSYLYGLHCLVLKLLFFVCGSIDFHRL